MQIKKLPNGRSQPTLWLPPGANLAFTPQNRSALDGWTVSVVAVIVVVVVVFVVVVVVAAVVVLPLLLFMLCLNSEKNFSFASIISESRKADENKGMRRTRRMGTFMVSI